MPETPASIEDLGPEGVAVGIGALLLNATRAQLPNMDPESFAVAKKWLGRAPGKVRVAKTAVGAGAAVWSASSLTVAATSGAGIASGLAAAGGVVGGGMAAGPGVLAAGPAYLVCSGLDSTLFKDEAGLGADEAKARKVGRYGTKAGALGGALGVGKVVVAAGASGPAIMGTLASVGGAVGGGAIAGAALLAAAPALAAGALGYGAYRVFGGDRNAKVELSPHSDLDGDTLALVVGDGEESYSIVGTAYWDGTILGMLGADGEPAFPIPPSTYDRIETVPKPKRVEYGGATHLLMIQVSEVEGLPGEDAA